MKRTWSTVVVAAGLLMGVLPAPSVAAAGGRTPTPSSSSFAGLTPGRPITLRQRIPVNVVFLGFDSKQINTSAFLKGMPETSTPIVRAAAYAGGPSPDMGLRFDFDVHVSFASRTVTDGYFAYLKSIGIPIQPTIYQQLYNNEAHNRVDVTGPVLLADGPSAEAWLEGHLGLPANAYTIVFVNWYGRPDFQFHLYYAAGQPDPDTGWDFGLQQNTGMIAWGGSHGRLWFDDLSAGPDYNTTNWEVDQADLDGDGIADARIPPIWEYAKDGFRKPNVLSGDLAAVARWVGLDTLFTTSPYIDPMATTPGPGGSEIVQTNLMEDDPSFNGLSLLRPDVVQSRLASVAPYLDWRTNLIHRDPIDPDARRAWRIASGADPSDDCWNAIDTRDAELLCYFDANRDRYFPTAGPMDHVGNVVAISSSMEDFAAYPFIGQADTDRRTGAPSYVWVLSRPDLRARLGMTEVETHESGHYFLGASHPHDGYDSERNILFTAQNPFLFVWLGDESATTMSYLFNRQTFSAFDFDNIHRWDAAGYLNLANDLLPAVLRTPGFGRYLPALLRADADALRARAEFARWQYGDAATDARAAQVEIATVATALGVTAPSRAPAAVAAPTARGKAEPEDIQRPTPPELIGLRDASDPASFQPWRP